MARVKLGFTTQQLLRQGRTTVADLEAMRTWLGDQRALPDLTDEQMALFLLACNNHQERTQNTIKAYYSIRKDAPELFNDRNMDREDLLQQTNTFEYCALPQRTDDGCAVVFCRLYDTYYANTVMASALKLCFMVMDSILYDDPPKGLVVLIDLKGTGLMHLTRVRLGLVKTFCRYVQDAVPVKITAIHVLNTVYFIDKLLMLFKPFLHNGILELVRFHQPKMDMESFYQDCLPKSCLPEDYGGDLASVRQLHEKTVRRLVEMQADFEAEEEQRRGFEY